MQKRASWYYYLLRFLLRLSIRVYFRRIDVEGREHLENDHPWIVAPNHRSAFLDAMLPAVLLRRPLWFLARADVFKSERAAKLLRGIRLMPVYRIRDGRKQLHRNEAIFATCRDLLAQNQSILIFPEGEMQGKHQLVAAKKGFARIALAGQAAGAEVRIVPLAVQYESHPVPFRSRVAVKILPPIPARDYFEANPETEASRLNDFRKTLDERLRQGVTDFPEDNFALRCLAFDLHRQRAATPVADLAQYNARTEKFLGADTHDVLVSVQERLQAAGLTQPPPLRPFVPPAWYYLGIPFACWGLLHLGFLGWGVDKLARRFSPEPTFLASIRVALGALFGPIYLLSLALIAGRAFEGISTWIYAGSIAVGTGVLLVLWPEIRRRWDMRKIDQTAYRELLALYYART